MASVTDLGKAVKAKYPGAYDDMDDAVLGRRVKAKFPGDYDDFADEEAGPSFTDKAINMIGRGAWALPGLVGLDHERVQSLVTGTPREAQLALSRRVDAENPITSGVVRGVAAAPAEALAWMAAPEAKLPQTASALEKFIRYGPRMGTLAGASEYGSTSHKDPLSRAGGAAAAGGLGAVLGGAMAGALPNPAALVPSRPSFDPAAPELALARAEGSATAASRSAADAAAAAQGGNAAAQNATTVVVKPPKRILPAALQPPEMIPEAKYLADRGVPLTGGLRDPNSAYGHMEIASQSRGIVGPGIRNQRHRALGQAMDLAFEEAKPPPVSRPGATNLAPEEYLYHVTPAENAESIATQGLRADAPKIGEGGPHGNTRAVFLADQATVDTYRSLYGAGGAPLEVYRVPRSALRSVEDDAASEGAAYLSRENIPASLLERETPDGWEGVGSARPTPPQRIGSAGNPNDKYLRLKTLWDREFDAVRASTEPIQPAVIRGEEGRPLPALMDEIVSDVASAEGAVWDDASRVQAKKFLDNQMSRLFGRQKDEAGRVPLGDVMQTLSDVRAARRAAQQREKWDLVDIYARAEDAIEESITSQASPAMSKRLGELFGGYRNFKIVEDAVLRMKDAPGGITPARLESSVASVVGRGSEYARGGGGPIRDLSKSVRTVFDESGAPPTGARLLADVGWLTDKIAGPTIYLRNRSAASAQGGAASSEARSAALAAARARSSAAASNPVPDGLSDALMEFVSRPTRTLRPQNAATALPPELVAWLRAKYGLAPGAATAEEDAP
jgi:hypothetical protein